ncbi:MAG: hypothetical protein LIP01_04370 [Tannerellaceae bacterium]|nr:hypothetical protein [Tannerellaceae bacterium]
MVCYIYFLLCFCGCKKTGSFADSTSDSADSIFDCTVLPDSTWSLPEKNSYKVIAASHTDSLGYTNTTLYTFDADQNPCDHLQVESTEKIEPYSLLIIQHYTIDEDYRITETKYLDSLLIEQLTYEITDKGEFAEIRDGSIPITTYEMFSNSDNFIIESFIWEKNSKGELRKKDLKQTTYHLKAFMNNIR